MFFLLVFSTWWIFSRGTSYPFLKDVGKYYVMKQISGGERASSKFKNILYTQVLLYGLRYLPEGKKKINFFCKVFYVSIFKVNTLLQVLSDILHTNFYGIFYCFLLLCVHFVETYYFLERYLFILSEWILTSFKISHTFIATGFNVILALYVNGKVHN